MHLTFQCDNPDSIIPKEIFTIDNNGNEILAVDNEESVDMAN